MTMPFFSAGLFPWVLGTILAVLYLLDLSVRKLWARAKYSEPPRDRVAVVLLFIFACGFVVGSFTQRFAQAYWYLVVQCQEDGQPVLRCVLLQGRAPP
ncbi:MAG TPA: hypothetical protein VMK12_06335 [Anaeromyxobacteraceae bacterium]|nr:hypothetical protein [Anaeromyxobacteraceae bacterium]